MERIGFGAKSFGFRTFGFGSEVAPEPVTDAEILAVFSGDKQGVWYDPSDKSTLFQDAEGTIPVTANGDPVGKMLDKSGNGNHAVQRLSTARPIYKTDGLLHWIDSDGTDDNLYVPNFKLQIYSTLSIAAQSNTGLKFFIEHGADTNYYNGFFVLGGINSTLKKRSNITTTVDATNASWFGDVAAIATFIYDGTPTILRNGINVPYVHDGNIVTGINDLLIVDTLNINSRSGIGLYQKNKIYGILMFDGLAGSNRGKIEAYLANKAGVTL